MIKGYKNGKIFTSNDVRPYIEAMVVKDGVICWVGNTKDLDVTKCDEIIDFDGQCVIPGFIDAHTHPVMLAKFSKQISCLPPKINSIAELTKELRGVSQKMAQEQWIEGWGYDEGKLAEQRSPTRYDLDKGCKENPVSILRTCAHIRCVNSKALELAGITKDTPDPEGGQIDRDINGEPTGILRENARSLITEIMPRPSKEEIINQVVDLGNLLLSQGIVAVTDMGNLEAIDSYEYFEAATKKGFKQEVAVYYFAEHYLNDATNELCFTKEKTASENQIKMMGIKLIGDGSISGHTACVEEPYIGTDDYGIETCTDEELEKSIEFCKKNRCQLSVHAMGGRTIERIIDVVSKEKNWMEDETIPHVRLEHVTEPNSDSIEKAAANGIAFATQPIFQYCEIETYLNNLGIERTKKAYPIKTLLEKNINLCLSTDAPATSWAVPSDPFPNLKMAVTRTAYDGTDCGKEETIDIETAIKLYTKKSAEISGFKRIGQLVEGFKADFVVLSDDIFEIKPEDIDKVHVNETYILGEKVYDFYA